jgi:hypothetical protein
MNPLVDHVSVDFRDLGIGGRPPQVDYDFQA